MKNFFETASRRFVEGGLQPGIRALQTFAQEKLGNRRRLATYILGRLLQDGIRPTSIIDHGCGTGTTADALAELAPQAKIYCTDIKDHRADPTKRSNIEYRLIAPCRLRDKRLLRPDLILIIGVLHHVAFEQEDEFLNDVFEVMSPDARLFIHEVRLSPHPIRRAIEKVVLHGEELVVGGTEGMNRTCNFFTRARLVDLLKKHGFEIIEMHDVEGRYVTLPAFHGNMLLYCRKMAPSASS